MPLALGVWGLTLEPGKKYEVEHEYDVHLTGATFGETVEGDGRSLLKIHTFAFPEDDEDDDDDEEEEDDVDEKDVGELKETVLCALVPGRIEYQSLNMILPTSDEPVLIEVTGTNTVHLSGNFIEQLPERSHGHDDDEFDSDYDLSEVPSDAEMDSDEYRAILNGEMDEDEDDEDEEMEGEPKIAEILEEGSAKKSKKRSRAADEDEDDEDAEDSSAKPAAASSDADASAKLSKAEKKRLKKKMKGETGEAKPAPNGSSPAAPTTNGKDATKAKKSDSEPSEKKDKSKKKELPGGIVIQDIKTGTGPQAKNGKKVSMRYIGKLGNGKIFDSNTKGKPFEFVLGKGDVIKGWDEGIVGMSVGGERKITIPPSKAYGSKQSGPIPPNSTLTFECKMVGMN